MSELRIPANGISLREFRLNDADHALSIVGDERVTRSLSFSSRNREETQRMLAAAIASSQALPRAEYYLAVAQPITDRVIGFTRLALGGTSAAKLGYAIHADYWHRGYATSAARALCNFGFGTLGLHRITAATAPDNVASSAVLKHLGFSPEGRLRDHIYKNGSWRDSLLFSLLASD